MIAQLEDAIIDRIKAAQAANLWAYELPTIESYAGQIAEDTQATFRFPAVFVSFVRWRKGKALGERGRTIHVELMIYVAARNPRNEKATRHGDAHEVGSYQIAEDIVALLENQRLGFPMHIPLSAEEVKTVYVSRKADGHNAESILAIPFQCSFGWEASLPECANVTTDDWLATGQEFYLTPDDGDADLSAFTQHENP